MASKRYQKKHAKSIFSCGAGRPEHELIQTSFMSEASRENSRIQRGCEEHDEKYKEEYSSKYRETRIQICESLKDNLAKILETTVKKEEQIGRSLETYFKLENALKVILVKMNEILENTKTDKRKLQKEQNLPSYASSTIKIRSKNLRKVEQNKQFMRQASKGGQEQKFIDTNAVSFGFLNSMNWIIWNNRKYFFRLVDYVSKMVIINQVSPSSPSLISRFFWPILRV